MATDDRGRRFLASPGWVRWVLDDGEASKAFFRARPGHFEPVDAAHIIEDHAEEGVPTVPNGLSLCKLHHAAFDRHFLGIRPDHRILIRPDLLGEKDGPTLLHSIQITPHAEARMEDRDWAIIVEPDFDQQVLVVITAYPTDH